MGDTVTWSGLANAHNVTGTTTADLSDFCGTSTSSFATETSCSDTFTTAGTFPYECTIHGPCCGMIGTIIVVAAAPTPAVTITNPVGGATFIAPASVSISASASVSSGTVTNVAFFGKTNNVTTSLGSAHSAPFTVTAANLAAGSYSLTAVATARGSLRRIRCGEHYPSSRQANSNITNPARPTAAFRCTTLGPGAMVAASSGSVTDVAFFATDAASTNSLGSAQASPFDLTAGSLAAGNYSLIAVATAAGVSTTSSAVNVSVVSPVAISNSVPVVAGGHFSFNYSANVGLTYVVQRSSDLINWPAVSTNVASNNPVHFTDSVPVNGSAFYRVARQPNP